MVPLLHDARVQFIIEHRKAIIAYKFVSGHGAARLSAFSGECTFEVLLACCRDIEGFDLDPWWTARRMRDLVHRVLEADGMGDLRQKWLHELLATCHFAEGFQQFLDEAGDEELTTGDAVAAWLHQHDSSNELRTALAESIPSLLSDIKDHARTEVIVRMFSTPHARWVDVALEVAKDFSQAHLLDKIAEVVASAIHTEYMMIVDETCICADSQAAPAITDWGTLKWNVTGYASQVKDYFAGKKGAVFAFKVT